MKKLMKWLGVGAGSLAGVGVLAFCAIYAGSMKEMRRTYNVVPAPFAIPDDSATVARGRHLATAIAKCADCHGADYSGKVMIDDPMLGRVVADNITPGGVTARYSDADWIRAIRHGIRPDSRSVVVMPSYEFNNLDDGDLAAVIAYMKTLPARHGELPETRFGPIGRFLMATGAFPILSASVIDHAGPRPAAIVPAATPEYGQYIASVGCVGCHGATLEGGKPPAPPAPDISASGRAVTWTEQQLATALRAGLRPDGTVMNTEMPWPAMSAMTDTEIGAVYAYLQSLRMDANTAVASADRQ